MSLLPPPPFLRRKLLSEPEETLEQRGAPGRQVFGITGTSSLHSSNTPAAPHSSKLPRMGAQCPHRYPDPANKEDSRVLKERSHQARQDSPQAPWAVPLPSCRAIPASPHPKRNEDPLPQETHLQTEQGRQPRSHPMGVKPVLARSQQASCCPRHGDKLLLEPPNLSAPATHSPPDSPAPFSAPAQTSHPTNPPTQQGDHPPLCVPTQECLWHPSRPHCCCPTPLHGTHPAQWGQGLGREATQTVLRAFGPVLGFLLGLSHCLCPSPCKQTQPAPPLPPCLPRGSPRLHPSPVLGAEELMPRAKNWLQRSRKDRSHCQEGWGCLSFMPQDENKRANSPHPHKMRPISSDQHVRGVHDPSRKGTGSSPGRLSSSLRARRLCGVLGCSG